MPFARDDSPDHIKAIGRFFQEVLRNHIASNFGLEVRRADDIFDTRPIMQSIWDSILEAEIVVADLTDRNPNVFYEAGLADAIGKEMIFIARNMDDVPFDLRHRRIIQYKIDYPGPEELKRDLIETIKNILNQE